MDSFNNNQGCGGFERGSYNDEAIHPIEANWTRQSQYMVPSSIYVSKRVGSSGLFHYEYNMGSFVVDRNGRALVAVEIEEYRVGKLYRVNLEDEQLEVIFEIEGGLFSPILVKNDAILVTNSNNLISLSENGEMNWQAKLDGIPLGSPVVSEEGYIYLCTYEDEEQIVGRLYSFDSDGVERWVYTCASIFWCDPILSDEGIIYIGQNVTSKLCALNKDGKILWEKKIGQGLASYPPVIDSDGILYWCLSNKLYALDRDGEVRWIYQPDEALVITSPTLSTDGFLYVHQTGGKLICLTRDGQLCWSTEAGYCPLGPPIVGKSGYLIQNNLIDNSIDGYSSIEIFSPDGKRVEGIEIEGSVDTIILANDGVIYALSSKCTRDFKAEWELYLIRSVE